MFSRRLKIGYFILEGLNSFATVYYFYYLFFFMQKGFGFGNKANLSLAALAGAITAVAAWWGGRFAQRFGYFTALKAGFLVMMVALAAGLKLSSATGQIVTMSATVVGMCFTWPSLEALVSEGEAGGGVQDMVGVYNVVWAGTAALANFTGGAMFDKLGPQSLFYVPAAILLCQLGLTLCLESWARGRTGKGRQIFNLLSGRSKTPRQAPGSASAATGREPMESLHHEDPPVAVLVEAPDLVPEPAPVPEARARTFLRLAWLANPFAYIAINTVVAAMPVVARNLELSTTLAGFCGSVWCFSRVGAFFGLWCWGGWHYRFGWLLLAYVCLAGAFAAILLVPNLAVVVLAQVLFGAATGLIYYSSLFYSMHRSQTKGEHGGIHEAAIGLGNCVGPAVGAAALHFLPRHANSAAVAVTVLLVLGLGGLAGIWRMEKE